MQTSGGATLIEMLTAVTIIAVVGAAAIPAFGELRRDAERNDVVNRLYHALYLARSESLTRGEVVSVCKSRDGVGCARGRVEWGAGWIVFINADRDDPPERDADEAAIAVYSGWPHGRVTSNRLGFTFRPHVQGVVNGTITVCDSRGPQHARAVIVNHAGRPRISKRDSSGRLLRCPGRTL